MRAKPQELIIILGSKHSGCMNGNNTVTKITPSEQQHAHIEPHLVAGGAFARPIQIQFLTASKSYLNKCTRALILDRLACKELQEHFANSFAIKANV